MQSNNDQQKVNVIASQFTVQKVQPRLSKEEGSQAEFVLPTENEINEDVLNAHRD